MSNDRRQAVADVCARHGIWIIEDDPGIPIVRDEVVPLSSFLPAQSVYVCDPSPLLHPGIRGCYIQAPACLIGRLSQMVLATLGRGHHLEHEVMRLWIESGTAERLIRLRLMDYRGRQAIARQVLSGCEYQTHPSDSELWLRLSEHLDEQKFVGALRACGVHAEPGTAYEVRPGAGRRRVCYHLGLSPAERLRAQLQATAQLIHSTPD
jgi:DNA-binding transcriptional MocR family regulator